MEHQNKGSSSLKGQNEGKLARAVAGNTASAWTSFSNYAAAQNGPIPCACEETPFMRMEQQKAQARRLLLRNEVVLC